MLRDGKVVVGVESVIVIPTYWSDEHREPHAPGLYDRSIDLNNPEPELDRCLASLEQVRDLAPIVLLVVCPLSATNDVTLRVRRIVAAHPSLQVTLVTNVEAARIMDRVNEIAPNGSGECVSLRGYGAIRNMGLAVASILRCASVIFLDDDEVVIAPDFMERAQYAVGRDTRQGLPILAKSGYFYDENGSALADSSKAGITTRWWTKRLDFNEWMEDALSGTRISRSNYLCGGCFIVHARAYRRVSFDPYITRGEDFDYLCNLRLHGLDVWFDNQWVVQHLPEPRDQRAPRFMQDVYRWYYERAKLADASRRNELNSVTAASLMPYPGPWISSELDERVRKTAFVRALFTREHAAYWRIWRQGRNLAERYARENTGKYLRFQSFWPSIMDRLWGDVELSALLRGAR